MANEALVREIERINGLARAGAHDDSYNAFRDLFASPDFVTYRPEDQRQALRIMVLAKGVPQKPTSAMMEAHRAAVAPLTELVSVHLDPGDHEMLGICHVMLGNEDSASRIFRAGLALERERSAGSSDLCGSFMKRIAAI